MPVLRAISAIRTLVIESFDLDEVTRSDVPRLIVPVVLLHLMTAIVAVAVSLLAPHAPVTLFQKAMVHVGIGALLIAFPIGLADHVAELFGRRIPKRFRAVKGAFGVTLLLLLLAGFTILGGPGAQA